MTSGFKKKSLKWSMSLLIAFLLCFAAGLSAMAASDDLVFDNYDRSALADFASSNAGAQWTGGDAGKSATLDDNALKLEYGSKGWFGTGGGIDASSYKYLKITIKGAAGGEGADFDLNYAVGETVKTIGKNFADLSGAAITKDFQDIYIDLAANEIDKGIQALHFNFLDGKSGTIWIDDITFTNSNGAAEEEPAKESAGADDSGETDATTDDTSSDNAGAEANPKTGDSMNLTLYVTMAMISGLAALAMVYKVRKANRD
ncbi:sortase B protein-sorting domain-containing protein [Cohnella luojiensis]|nr:sortase B protein-sorting domain-containing protein [Cohnella luojiensis]